MWLHYYSNVSIFYYFIAIFECVKDFKWYGLELLSFSHDHAPLSQWPWRSDVAVVVIPPFCLPATRCGATCASVCEFERMLVRSGRVCFIQFDRHFTLLLLFIGFFQWRGCLWALESGNFVLTSSTDIFHLLVNLAKLTYLFQWGAVWAVETLF